MKYCCVFVIYQKKKVFKIDRYCFFENQVLFVVISNGSINNLNFELV